tara:strand:+ start:2145 stop:2549 length:405 start_codon:yes stop_codon:yes gene_type:complete
MGNVIKNVKCGHCGYSWRNGVEESDGLCGPPLIKCRICNKINKTNRVLFKDLNIVQKIRVYGNLVISVLVFGIIPLIAGIVGIFKGEYFFVIMFIIGVFFTWFGLFKEINYYKERDALYDLKGFLWSDEEYPNY